MQKFKFIKFVTIDSIIHAIIIVNKHRYLYTMTQLKTFTDERGSLTLLEGGIDVPFQIARVYWLHSVPAGRERGKHANKIASQYLLAINGSVDVTIENTEGRRTVHLDSKNKGLLVPAGTWNELSNFSENAVLIVFSSQLYRPETYLNTYEEFKAFINQSK